MAATLLSAAGLWLGNGLEPVWWLMWIAPLPVLLVALRSRATAGAAAVVFAAWFAGGLNLWSYLRTTIGVPAPVPLLTAALLAAVVTGGVLLARRHARRGRWATAALALPATWTAFELACARLSPHGSFGSLAPSQADFLPIVKPRGAGRRQRHRLPAALRGVRRGRGLLCPALRAGRSRWRSRAPWRWRSAMARGGSRRPTSRASASPSASRRAITRSSRPPWPLPRARSCSAVWRMLSRRCTPRERR